jgi:DNA-binding NarL/FixJ family response regulator
MVRSCCLAGIEGDKVAILSAALRSAGAPLLSSVESLSVTRLGQLRPDLCICDLDGAEGDPLETLRQIRFVLPGCLLGVYTADSARSWVVACHLAGANALISKDSTEAQIARGLRGVMASGCFTDPRFAAA